MSIQLFGNQKVKDIYIGNKNISKVYSGNNLVYDKNRLWIVKNGILVYNKPLIIPLYTLDNSVLHKRGEVSITQKNGYVLFYGQVTKDSTRYAFDSCLAEIYVNQVIPEYNYVHGEFMGGTYNTSSAPTSQQYRCPSNCGGFCESIIRNWTNNMDYRYNTYVQRDSNWLLCMRAGRFDQSFNAKFVTTLEAQVKNLYFYKNV